MYFLLYISLQIVVTQLWVDLTTTCIVHVILTNSGPKHCVQNSSCWVNYSFFTVRQSNEDQNKKTQKLY